MSKWSIIPWCFKRYRHYHVSYVCTKNGVNSPTFADQLVVTNKKINGYFLQELRDNAKKVHGYDGVAIMSISKL